MNQWLIRLLANQMLLLDTPKDNPTPPPTPPAPAPDLNAVLARLDALEKENKALKDKNTPNPEPADLATQVKKDKEKADEQELQSKQLEAALRFTMNAPVWIKENASLLPKSIEAIIAAADKEKYSSAVAKDRAIKTGIISEYFGIQSNLDQLTPSLKSQLEDFLLLTKDKREERAQSVYDAVFEPAFESHKRVEKAKQLAKGHAAPNDKIDGYKQKLIDGGKRHYLGEKPDAR